MRKSRFTENPDRGDPQGARRRNADRGARPKHGIHPNALRQWRAKYGGMEVAKVRALTDENERLKRIVA
jgi:transposase-like protein